MKFYLLGILSGLIFYFPIGVVGLYIYDRAIHKGLGYSILLAFFTSFLDGLYVAIVFYGISPFAINPKLRVPLQIFAILLLVFVLFFNKKFKFIIKERNKKFFDFLFILSNYLFNPSLPIFLINFTVFMIGKFHELSKIKYQFLFSFGITSGSFFILVTMIYFINRYKSSEKAKRVLIYLRNIFAFIIIGSLLIDILKNFIK
ncbi:hypothetical protein DEFDS_0607 [Deferribacter desulfuricans SSM1]|uniref:Lysine transporter LysE n=1 Tax=Deferribacter desulfuricans (strain DSM 14783 / JCM 11476 / NBRC 101012 / SSM1) TaxID=639282 RepID=D3PBW6_DEFDS|nr:hypothetical protein [Deferribacter desulfuricans]BAI80089.1 hypothetical protein DEFDS_0607 [Deferribacter desulfuricans SSM1]